MQGQAQGAKRPACWETRGRATPLPDRRRRAMAHEPPRAGDQGPELGGARVAGDGERWRVRTAKLSTPWRPDTPSHRPLTVVG
jgi:hypothetical protein